MSFNSSASSLSQEQILQQVYDATNGLLKTSLADNSGTAITVGQKAMAASVPVVVASDQTALSVKLQDGSGSSVAKGQTTMSGSLPVVLASDQSTVSVTPQAPTVASYMTCTYNLSPAANATDIFTIAGSGSKTIKVTKLIITGTQTTAGVVNIALVLRDAADSGGTSTTCTNFKMDSTNGAGTATVKAYTANPTLGNGVGVIAVKAVELPAATSIVQAECVFEFGKSGFSQPLVLRGTAEMLAVSLLGATPSGASLNIIAEWVEV